MALTTVNDKGSPLTMVAGVRDAFRHKFRLQLLYDRRPLPSLYALQGAFVARLLSPVSDCMYSSM